LPVAMRRVVQLSCTNTVGAARMQPCCV
jgi:hypothetical protein